MKLVVAAIIRGGGIAVPVVLGLMVVVFGCVGVGLLVAAWKWAAVRRASMRRSLRIEGVLIGVDRKEVRPSQTERARRRRAFAKPRRRYSFFPRILFTTPDGAKREFVASSGRVAEESPYVVGSTISVRYDPLEVAPPAVDSIAGLWGPSIAAGCGGLVFTAVSIGLGIHFGSRMLAG